MLKSDAASFVACINDDVDVPVSSCLLFSPLQFRLLVDVIYLNHPILFLPLKLLSPTFHANASPQLNQNQYDALVSFTFNLGCGNEADIAPLLNSGDFKAATDKMLEYVNAGGQVLEGLVRRRKEEVAYFNS